MKQNKVIKKRVILSISQKKLIKAYGIKHPKLTHIEIAKHFSEEFHCMVGRKVVGQIIKNDGLEKLIESVNRKRELPVISKELEQAMLQWISMANERGTCTTDLILQEKASRFVELLNLTWFKSGKGWIAKFKKRNNLKSYLVSGEIASIEQSDIKKNQ